VGGGVAQRRIGRGPLLGGLRALVDGLQGQAADVLGVDRVLQEVLGYHQPVAVTLGHQDDAHDEALVQLVWSSHSRWRLRLGQGSGEGLLIPLVAQCILARA
jgi:hypothetical protein